MFVQRDTATFPRRASRFGAIIGLLVVSGAFAACASSSAVEPGRTSSSSSSSSSGAGGAGSGGGAGEGGAATPCTPSAVTPCYSGPMGTEGVGVCKGGTHTCKPDGSGFGACEGEVTPAGDETCATAEDDDCNGVANDKGVGCICAPSAVEACYGGPAGTQGVGQCKEGSRTCDALGASWSPCDGEVLPSSESCGNAGDEDCDGSACAAALWSIIFGGSGPDQVGSVAVDTSGNIYVAGTFSGAMTIGGTTVTSAGGTDVFLGKFDPQGTLTWVQTFGDASNQGGTGVAVDALGNVILIGYFSGMLTLGGTTYTANAKDAFVAKFGDTGAYLWSKKIGVAGDQMAVSVATDSTSSILVTGSFEGQLICPFGCVTSKGLKDIFVFKFSDQGAQTWLKVFGDPEDQTPSALAVDSLDNVVVVGQLKGSAVDFGNGNLLGSAGGYDAFVVKLDSATGVTTWVQRYGDPLDQFALAVATGPADAIAIAGTFKSSINLGALDRQSSGLSDVFIAGLGADGAYKWDHTYGDASEQTIGGLAFDAGGGIVLSGGFQGSVDFGGGAITSLVSYDQFLVRLTDTGAYSWSQRFGDASSQIGAAVIRDVATGHLFVTANASGVTDYGNGALTSAGGDDITLVKLSP